MLSTTDQIITYAPPSSELLLERTARGDRAAFGILYDRVSSRVYGVVRRVLIDPAQSEEVVQDIFVEVWENAARFAPGKGKAITWILTMAHRRAIDRVRSSQASRDRDRAVGLRDLDVPFDSVAESIEISIEFARVTAALSTLSEIQRESVMLAYHGGYTHKELSEMLGVPLGTVKTRLRDGLINLRRELEAA